MDEIDPYQQYYMMKAADNDDLDFLEEDEEEEENEFLFEFDNDESDIEIISILKNKKIIIFIN